MTTEPKVSVVIPTRDRPLALKNAITSALAQTLSDIEVIVVIDGGDGGHTLGAVTSFGDKRLSCITLKTPAGAAQARNIGVQNARSRFVALLDDDDEWMPTKLEKQFALADEYADGTPLVVTTQHIHRARGAADVVRPRRLPRQDEAVTEFMFDYLCYFQTSTFFCSKQLISTIPFDSSLPSLQDVDWFLRVMRQPKSKLLVVPEPLTIYHSPDGRATITNGTRWKSVLDWGRSNRRFMTRRAYSRFIVGSCVGRAVKQRAGVRGLATLLYECIINGSPTPKLLCLLCGTYMLTPDVRIKLRDRFMLAKVSTPIAMLSGSGGQVNAIQQLRKSG